MTSFIKKFFPRIMIGLVLALIGSVIFAHPAHAQLAWAAAQVLDVVNDGLASLMNALMSVAALLVTIAGALLNVSITLTLHIKEFVNATPAIYTIWQTIRDMTGLFFIFFLLYAAFQMILGSGNYGDLLVKIVTAGVLINFSFFIVSLEIDASNIVSQAIYNAMLPNAPAVSISTNTVANNGLASLVSATTGLENGNAVQGLSNIFMNSLKIQTVYNNQGNAAGSITSDPFKIILIGVIGVVIMVTAAGSFVLAAAAFIARLVILLFMLAFSPILFAAEVIPQLKQKAGTLHDTLWSQLLFMPVYLLLLYAALRILNESSIFGALATINTSSSVKDWAFGYVVIMVNFAMVIIMLNLPLVVGLGMGGWATKFMSGKMKSWGAENIWKNVGSQAGSRTLGRTAAAINDSRIMRSLTASSPAIGRLASSTVGKVSSSGFGVKKGSYNDRLKAKKEADIKAHKALAEIDRGDFAPGDEGKAAFEKAKERAKTDQENYRKNLPWARGSVMGFMLENRGHLQAQAKLKDEADKAEQKKRKSSNKKKLKEIDDQLTDLKNEEKEIGNGSKPGQVGAEAGRLARIKEAREKLEADREKIQKDQDEIAEIEEADKEAKITGVLNETKSKVDRLSEKEENKTT
ncbi:MAG: hypothetical protein WCT02_01195 [Candidatus Paceibacterota bacterium]